MTNSIRTVSEDIIVSKRFKMITWSFVGFYPFLQVWHGLDVTDIGYWLTAYNSFFDSPHSITSQLHLWLTLFLGGSFEYIFSQFGHIGHRLFYLLIFYATLLFSYRSTRLLSLKTHPLLWFATVVLTTFWGTKLGHYFSFSMVFYAASFYLLLKSLINNNRWYYAALGCVVMLNVFIKFPNILGVVVFTTILLLCPNKREGGITQGYFRYYLLGILLAVCTTLSAIVYLGHLQLYINSLVSLFHAAGGSGSHGTSSLLKITSIAYAKNISIIVALLVVYIIQTKIPPHLDRVGNILSTGFVASIAVTFLFLTPGTKSSIIYVTNALCVVGTLILLTKIKTINLRAIALITATSILVVTPLGSNTGLVKSVFAYPIIIPIVVSLMFEQQLEVPNSFKRVYPLMLTLLPILSLTHAISPYRDQTTTRLEFKTRLQGTRSDYIFSSKERVVILQELCDFLKTKVNKGEKILAYEKLAMVYYYTKTHPWLPNPWPLLLGQESISARLNVPHNEHPTIIVRSKYSTSNPYWPIQKSPLLKMYGKSRQVIQEFIESHSYSMVWHNDFFEVFEKKN
jgi:hypothetical protein